MLITGNLWLNSTSAIERHNRKFATREEFMDEFNAKFANKYFGPSDSEGMYILGNIGIGSEAYGCINRAYKDGEKVFLVPAASDDIKGIRKALPKITILPSVCYLKAHNVVLCAYQMADWPAKIRGSKMLYGIPTKDAIYGTACVGIDYSLSKRDDHYLPLRYDNLPEGWSCLSI